LTELSGRDLSREHLLRVILPDPAAVDQ
ncbi:MAG: hypothetical protein QOI76_3903, partial [Frankiales bacterium]|nr:hypothetical protein [Frankiales bacterium]